MPRIQGLSLSPRSLFGREKKERRRNFFFKIRKTDNGLCNHLFFRAKKKKKFTLVVRNNKMGAATWRLGLAACAFGPPSLFKNSRDLPAPGKKDFAGDRVVMGSNLSLILFFLFFLPAHSHTAGLLGVLPEQISTDGSLLPFFDVFRGEKKKKKKKKKPSRSRKGQVMASTASSL